MRGASFAAALVAAFGLASTAGGAAHAAVQFSLAGGTAGSIPDAGQVNNVIAGPTQGFFGAQVSLVGGSAPILVEFLGFEAAFQNVFSFAGGGFSTEIGDIGNDNIEVFGTPPSYVTAALTGLLNFSFSTGGGGSVPAGTVTNGSNPDDSNPANAGMNFFASIVGDPTNRNGVSVLLFFDDDGANNDDNHDDMVIRLSVAEIPVPATLPLLFGALAGLGFVGRRRLRTT